MWSEGMQFDLYTLIWSWVTVMYGQRTFDELRIDLDLRSDTLTHFAVLHCSGKAPHIVAVDCAGDLLYDDAVVLHLELDVLWHGVDHRQFILTHNSFLNPNLLGVFMLDLCRRRCTVKNTP